ncbi:MAG TPA: phosphatidylserine synthase, partial [Flavobacteriales bacterium]|nr:phosphatidylserine synthase [Flavobacteriales bacterium]
IFFDFFDGLAARSFNVSSELGLQLDSLADMVTSGVVPAFVISFLLADSLQISLIQDFAFDGKYIWALFGFIIALASAYRLAKFNIDTRQSTSFIGLPTPANALFIVSLPLMAYQSESTDLKNIILNPYILSIITIISAYLLNAELPLFSLKFKDFSWQNNWQKYVLIIISILLIIFLKFVSVPLIIIIYILLSLIPVQSK